MLWKRPWGWIVMAVANLAPLVIRAADLPGPPFQVTWTAGACANCQTARGLGYVRFVDGADAWALGFHPPGETGFGDWTIVHTGDGGRTWRELPHSYQHNDPPSISFASARHGWVMVADMTTAEQRLMATTDGGAHWRRLPLRSLFVQAIQYVGRGHGFAYGFDPYQRQAYFYATADGGRSWRKSALPGGIRVEAMSFSDGRNGLLGGCLHGRIGVLRTTDGGGQWSATTIETPSSRPILNSDCDAEMDHLDLSAGGRAWLLVLKRSFANGDTTGFASAWSSPDGGRTWARKFETEFKNPSSMFTDFDGPYPLGDHLTLILERGPGDKASALYTQAGGGAWTEIPLAAPISNCLTARRGLVCSGAGFGLATITAGGGR